MTTTWKAFSWHGFPKGSWLSASFCFWRAFFDDGEDHRVREGGRAASAGKPLSEAVVDGVDEPLLLRLATRSRQSVVDKVVGPGAKAGRRLLGVLGLGQTSAQVELLVWARDAQRLDVRQFQAGLAHRGVGIDKRRFVLFDGASIGGAVDGAALVLGEYSFLHQLMQSVDEVVPDHLAEWFEDFVESSLSAGSSASNVGHYAAPARFELVRSHQQETLPVRGRLRTAHLHRAFMTFVGEKTVEGVRTVADPERVLNLCTKHGAENEQNYHYQKKRSRRAPIQYVYVTGTTHTQKKKEME